MIKAYMNIMKTSKIKKNFEEKKVKDVRITCDLIVILQFVDL